MEIYYYTRLNTLLLGFCCVGDQFCGVFKATWNSWILISYSIIKGCHTVSEARINLGYRMTNFCRNGSKSALINWILHSYDFHISAVFIHWKYYRLGCFPEWRQPNTLVRWKWSWQHLIQRNCPSPFQNSSLHSFFK